MKFDVTVSISFLGAGTNQHQLGALEQQKCTLSRLWRLQVQSQAVCKARSFCSEGGSEGGSAAGLSPGISWLPEILGVP